MARNLHAVLPCVGVWGAKQRYQHLVQALAVLVSDLSEGGGVAFAAAQRLAFEGLEKGVDDGYALGA